MAGLYLFFCLSHLQQKVSPDQQESEQRLHRDQGVGDVPAEQLCLFTYGAPAHRLSTAPQRTARSLNHSSTGRKCRSELSLAKWWFIFGRGRHASSARRARAFVRSTAWIVSTHTHKTCHVVPLGAEPLRGAARPPLAPICRRSADPTVFQIG